MSMPVASGCTTSKLRSSLWIFRVISRRCLGFISHSSEHCVSAPELVRAFAGRTAVCVVDRRRSQDSPPTVRKQKRDRQDAQLILQLLLENRFSADLGAELGELGSAAKLLWHRHRMVQARPDQLQQIAPSPARPRRQMENDSSCWRPRSRHNLFFAVQAFVQGHGLQLIHVTGSTESDHRGTEPSDPSSKWRSAPKHNN